MLQLRLVELACQERYGNTPITDWLDVTPDLANRIRNHLDEYKSFEQFVTLMKTRQMTEARIRRALLHILLDIRTSEQCMYAQRSRYYMPVSLVSERAHNR